MQRLARRSVLAALAVGLVLAAGPAHAGEKKATVVVDVVKASKEAGPSDAKVEKFRAQLDRFDYRSYKVVSTKRVTVEKGESETVDLPGGKTLTVRFKQVDKDGRVRLRLSIKGVVETSVSLSPGGSVVLGGPALPHAGGVLFVPVTLSR